MADHHIAENGLHLIHCTTRVMSEYSTHNAGEVAGFTAEAAKKIIEKGGGEYAARVMMKKTAPHWMPKHNPPLKAGTLQGVPASVAKTLIADGAAEYVTPEAVSQVQAAQEKADREHVEKMSATFRAQTQPIPKGK